MKYLNLVEKLQKSPENQGSIVMIKNGIFFISVGKDAIILNELEEIIRVNGTPIYESKRQKAS